LLLALCLTACEETVVESLVPFEATGTIVAWCSLQPSPCLDGVDAAPFVLAIPVRPGVASEGTLTLTVSGDLDDPVRETLRVRLEGVDLGVIVNNDPSDDAFDHPTDMGVDCETITMTAEISVVDLVSIVADGLLELTFSPPGSESDIDLPGCADSDEIVSATIEYLWTV
jgi:hypothetical protein